ncbi:substrate-binding periplasmic protein [Chitinimonas sp.]|uniref:substrate-binding periplasmic protein n=1 Tax=Chitinimonas sp. TaxID=1934313 RepID=UPI0035B1ACE6
MRIDYRCVLVLLAACMGNAADVLRLQAPELPPYVFQRDRKLDGMGWRVVSAALDRAGLAYTTSYVPDFGRIEHDLGSGASDGFFVATANAERDRLAELSEPVLISNWCWVFPASSPMDPKSADFRQKALVGTYLKTNLHTWLKEHDYQVIGATSKLGSLVKMLDAGRINTVFSIRDVFEDSLRSEGKDPANYRFVSEQQRPLGIYISKRYLAKHPDTMNRLNSAIHAIKSEAAR